jgi:hypothetical protein
MQHIANVVQAWRAGGYFQRVMRLGADHDRVKEFLLRCAGERPNEPVSAIQHPHYPCFPGLRNRTWHDPADFAAVRVLEDNFTTIRAEAERAPNQASIDYTAAAVLPRSWKRPWTLLRPRPEPRTWTAYLFYHYGVPVEPVTRNCPRTFEILQSLPRACLDYAWGDFVFSAMNPGAHLPAHCSYDNLRVRIHLGVMAPRQCALRVGDETRNWEEGKCLVFEDSFEHEVWNWSDTRRVVLLLDTWHPDLTDVEIGALTAGFRKSEVRRIFMHERLSITDSLPRFLPYMEASLAKQDEEPLVREYWGA